MDKQPLFDSRGFTLAGEQARSPVFFASHGRLLLHRHSSKTLLQLILLNSLLETFRMIYDGINRRGSY